MRPEIASLDERMKQGGDWRAFRDEIASLHAAATTEEEYVTLLEAHRNLVAVGKYAYDEETYAKLLPIAEAEYKMFLTKESLEGDVLPCPFSRPLSTKADSTTHHQDPPTCRPPASDLQITRTTDLQTTGTAGAVPASWPRPTWRHVTHVRSAKARQVNCNKHASNLLP
jgi:hypothetical protein